MNKYLNHEMEVTKKFYKFLCKEENQEPVKLIFKEIKGGSGSCSYYRYNGKVVPVQIAINIENCNYSAAYALLHEFAHLIVIRKYNTASHGAAFEKEFKRLQKKYENCNIAREFYF